MSNIFPTINATLNATSGVLLCSAFALIKAKKWKAHAYCMIAATVVSAIFLACYLGYHATHGEKSTAAHPGPLRNIYLLVLIPHLFLAVGMLPLIYLTLMRAYKRDWAGHKRVSTKTFWIWLYVSVTGVVVYFMLYHSSLT
jgi:uncharacterized membrane protein YozB (DUF420 family)